MKHKDKSTRKASALRLSRAGAFNFQSAIKPGIRLSLCRWGSTAALAAPSSGLGQGDGDPGGLTGCLGSSAVMRLSRRGGSPKEFRYSGRDGAAFGLVYSLQRSTCCYVHSRRPAIGHLAATQPVADNLAPRLTSATSVSQVAVPHPSNGVLRYPRTLFGARRRGQSPIFLLSCLFLLCQRFCQLELEQTKKRTSRPFQPPP